MKLPEIDFEVFDISSPLVLIKGSHYQYLGFDIRRGRSNDYKWGYFAVKGNKTIPLSTQKIEFAKEILKDMIKNGEIWVK